MSCVPLLQYYGISQLQSVATLCKGSGYIKPVSYDALKQATLFQTRWLWVLSEEYVSDFHPADFS